MRTRARLALAAMIAAAALSFSPSPQEEGVAVRSLKFSEPPLDDVAHVLKVVKMSADYELGGVTNRAGLSFEFHRKGAKNGDPVRSVFLAGRQEKERRGRFSMMVADLDYLRLGDAPKGCHRVFTALQEGGSMCRGSYDIPKTRFDFSAMRGGGSFAARADKGRIPLLYRVAGVVDSLHHAETPEEVVKKNAGADVLTVYLEVE